MRRWAAAGLALACIANPVAAEAPEAAACPIERAHYAMSSEEGAFAVTFTPAKHWPNAYSNLYLKLTTPIRSYWFSFAASNGYSSISLLPMTDPYALEAAEDGPQELPLDDLDPGIYAALRFFAMDRELAVFPDPPVKGSEAPAYLMMPDIGAALWYDVAYLSGEPGAERDPMPRAVFRLAGCSDEAPPEAYP